MTRIVAGSAGGRALRVPAKGTRPTSERVREALFSRLEHVGVIDGARVLDLYAGSGALGLEAVSRGASHAVLVESARDAARLCRENAAALGLTGRVEVATARVDVFLGRRGAAPDIGSADVRAGGGTGEPFDLAFLDPPYDLADDDLAAVLAALVAGWLAPGAVVVVERARRSGEPSWPAGLTPDSGRAYGDTALWFATVDG